MLRLLAAMWGVSGITLLLGTAVYRLSHQAVAAFAHPLSGWQWVVLLGVIGFMAYFEGYRGFQKGFSPRVAARALYLSRNATWVNGLLAPLFCLCYFGAIPRRQLSAILLTLTIIGLVFVMGKVPQPWRGIVDAGVVIGLLWGLVSMLVFAVMAFFRKEFTHSPELSLHYLHQEQHRF